MIFILIMSIIICILVMLVIIIFVVYYVWYIRSNEDINRDIPLKILYRNHNIVDLFEDIVRKYGNHIAMKKKNKDKWSNISYSEYYNSITEFSRNLLYFIGPHPRVAILSSNRSEWFYVHMGCIFSCGVSIAISTHASSEICSHIINQSCSDIIIVENYKQLAKIYNTKVPTIKYILLFDDPMNIVHKSNHLRDALKKIRDNILPATNNYDYSLEYETNLELIENIKTTNAKLDIMTYDFFVNRSISNVNTTTIIDFPVPDTDNVVSIIYPCDNINSGGIVITHKNIINSLRLIMNSIQCRSNITLYMHERIISYMPLDQIMTQIWDIYIPLVTIGTVYFANIDVNHDINNIDQLIKEIKPTLFMGNQLSLDVMANKIIDNQTDPNRLLNKLFVNKMIIKNIGMDKCKYFIVTTQNPSDKKDFFRDIGIEICELCTMNETTGPITMSVPGSSKGLGVPIVNVKINRYNSEITVKGDTVLQEYYKNLSATKSSFNEKGWFKTGMTGYVDRDGTLYLTGKINIGTTA